MKYKINVEHKRRKISKLVLENVQCFSPLNGYSNKLLEQLAFKTRPKIDEHMCNVMDKSTLQKSQQLQNNRRQIKKAVTF